MDTDKILRSTRAARNAVDLPVRPDEDLRFFGSLPEVGEAIILDTCAYIDQLQGRLPPGIADRIVTRSTFHSSLALSEICFAIGRLSPRDPRTQGVIAAIDDLVSEIPARGILLPSAEAKMRGSIMAGAMARVLGYNDAQRRKALMDGMMAAQAAEENLLFVTRNVADFDRLSQRDNRLKVAFYRI